MFEETQLQFLNLLKQLRKARGSIPPTIKLFAPKTKTNPPITFKSVCPAIILANNLTERLIGLDKYDMISIGTSKMSIGLGTPEGAKNFKILQYRVYRLLLM